MSMERSGLRMYQQHRQCYVQVVLPVIFLYTFRDGSCIILRIVTQINSPPRTGAGMIKRREVFNMIVTTTPSVEGRAIREYKGIVFGEVISGVNMFKDIGASIRNVFGGRSAGYEEELMKARTEALAELEQRAGKLGANAVIGVDIDYEVLGADNGMLMVTASGTAVVVD